MILLDTNVLSEFVRPRPLASVVSWLDEQPAGEVCTSAISHAELELGLMPMPQGQRQEALSQAAWAMFAEDFAGRCLPFEFAADKSPSIAERGRFALKRLEEMQPSDRGAAQTTARDDS